MSGRASTSSGEAAPRSSAQIVMPCRLGMHLRVASRLLSFVSQFQSEITVRHKETEANAKSMLGLLLVGASWRAPLTFHLVGADAVEAAARITEYFNDESHC